jgi:hypothetical protein
MLIKKVYRFCNSNNLAVMFKFIEEGVDKIEVSLDEENWYDLEFEDEESSVKIFQGFTPMQIVDVYYRWYKGNEVFSNKTAIVVNYEGYEKTSNIQKENIPIDFKIRKKSGALKDNSILPCIEVF